jgi:uncharacterized protein (TIGR03382 family)
MTRRALAHPPSARRAATAACGALAAWAALGASRPAAAATPPACGPDCARPGRYVVCNDPVDATGAVGGFTRLDSFEWICARLTPPTSGPFEVNGAYVFMGPITGSSPAIFELRVSPDAPGPTPAPQLQPPQVGNVQVPFSVTPSFVSMPLQPAYTGVTGDFRLCLLSGVDMPEMAIGYARSGIQAGRNFARANGVGWFDASTRGVPGDFVVRASILTTEMGPWMPGGECAAMPDAGVAADATAGAPDAAAPPVDAGVRDADPTDLGARDAGEVGTDALGPTDAASARSDAEAPLPDADALADATPALDAASNADAAGGADAARGEAPTLNALTPSRGANVAATAIVVTGAGFVEGATLRIGAIPATEVRVPGPTTLLANVPPSIAPGVYDVILQNPDGQAAVLPKGFEVTGPRTDEPSNCQATDAPAWAAAVGLVLARRRRRPRAGTDGA